MNFAQPLVSSVAISNLKHVKMLEEKNDNLQNADGQKEQESQENVITINQSALDEIDNSNAEENEDDSIQDKHIIPMLDYDSLSMEELTTELDKLVHNHKVMAIKDHVEEIRKSFMNQYHHLIDEKRVLFSIAIIILLINLFPV